MERLKRLRQQALNFSHCKDEFYYRFYKAYEQNAHLGRYERYAESFYTTFSGLTPCISEGELIVGKLDGILSGDEAAEWESTYRDVARTRCDGAGGGQDSHMAFDYEKLLSLGIVGVIGEIDRYLLDRDAESAAYYRCCRRCLMAVAEHAKRYAALASELAESETDSVRAEELRLLSRVCERVPMYPARDFYEALQSVHFMTYVISLNPFRFCPQQFQLGRPDRYLLPYYERDTREGRISRERAQLLLDCLGIQINNRVPAGLSSGYLVGGRDEDGSVVANDLTRMCMQVVSDVRLVYPAVGLCYVEDMPSDCLSMACEILSHGCSHPAIFNDDVIAEGLISWGVPKKDARSYIHSTCVEITPIAASNVWVASPYTNMVGLLLEAMDGEYESYEALFAALLERLDRRIEQNFATERKKREVRAQNSLNPLLSCFVNDCLAKGKDIEAGGARYNWIMPSFVGMANLVDSLYALKSVVYDERRLSLGQLREILAHNFEGAEALRLELLERLPKYGNNDDAVDGYFEVLIDHIVKKCRSLTGEDASRALIPSVFCWQMHEYFGRRTGATPDGRVAGFPLGDGSGPCQGRERLGPTASVLSSTKWEHRDLIGGVAVNMKFSKSTLGRDSLAAMESLIKAYMARGGFEMQINVTDRDTLLRAQETPAAYRDLVVRIGGYSDYFTRLSTEMQEELILRTEHKI
ncbi:MAG: hypothetical protein E7643_02060 [Ruminococcaceae bacterium]|nr:hypothetical protein [Oscillospiraceae bacterium]